jgi:hypothetical protein
MHLCQQPVLVLHSLESAHFSSFTRGETYDIDLSSVVPQKRCSSLGIVLERLDVIFELCCQLCFFKGPEVQGSGAYANSLAEYGDGNLVLPRFYQSALRPSKHILIMYSAVSELRTSILVTPEHQLYSVQSGSEQVAEDKDSHFGRSSGEIAGSVAWMIRVAARRTMSEL